MKAYIIILFCLIFTFKTNAQSNIQRQIKQVENGLMTVNVFEGETTYSLLERMKFYNVPGISITVIKDYRILWTKQYGVADGELNNPVTDLTLFNVGSLSKGMASLTALSLVQKGKLDLNENVNERLISWKIPKNKFSQNTIISPKLLMNHSSGAMHHYGVNYTRDNFPTITQLLNGEAPAREKPTIIDRAPGTEFLYSNPGFAILQQLVEDITQNPFHKTAKENVFDVLEMNNSTFEQPLPIERKKFASAGHRSNSIPIPVKRYYYPNTAAGGLWTTSSDFAKYVIELQKSFHGESNKVISQEIAREMLKTHISQTYGLGVFIRKIGNETYFSHMGDNAGFFAGFISHISDGYGVVVFTNSKTSPELIREINKSVAKNYNWVDFLPKKIKTVPISKNEILQFSGSYKVDSDNAIEIILKDGELILSNMNNEKLFHIGNNIFMIERRQGEIKFIKDANDHIAVYAFADEIGRLPKNKIRAIKMKPGEKLPVQHLNDGEFDEAIKQYRSIFKTNPKDNSVTENRFNRLGYQLMGKNKLQQALCVFKLNIEFYPNSSNAHDSYGEALAKEGKIEEALKSYQKALQLNPNAQNAKDMISKLKQR